MRKEKNEKTGKAAKKIAAKVLASGRHFPAGHRVCVLAPSVANGLAEFLPNLGFVDGVMLDLCSMGELRTICGSNLTQAPDRKAKR